MHKYYTLVVGLYMEKANEKKLEI